MRPVAVILCLVLFGLNAEAALLHVHKGDADTEHHHHSPSAHTHTLQVEVPPVEAEVSATDDDSSAVPIVLGKATSSQTWYLLAATLGVAVIEAPLSSHVPRFVVTPRAHGPPAGRSCSLRAPPSPHLL